MPENSHKGNVGGKAAAQTRLHRTHIGEHRVIHAAVAPFGGLLDDLVGYAGEEELFCYRNRDICGVGQHGLFVEDLRDDVLSAGEVVAEGMPRTVAGAQTSAGTLSTNAFMAVEPSASSR